MGIKEATSRQGLFPANFTRPIWKRCKPREIDSKRIIERNKDDDSKSKLIQMKIKKRATNESEIDLEQIRRR